MSDNVYLRLEEAVYESYFLLKAMEENEFENEYDRRRYMHLAGSVRGKLMEAYNALMDTIPTSPKQA